MIKTFARILFLTLILSSHHAYTQATNQDSLVQVIQQNTLEDSSRIAVLIELGKLNLTQSLEKSSQFLNEALTLASQNRLFFLRAKCQQLLAQNLALRGDTEAAIVSGLAAIRTFDSLGRKQDVLITQGRLIPIYASEGFHEKALEMSLESLDQVKDEPETASKGRYYFNVGNSYLALRQHSKALEYFDKAYDLSRKSDFKPGIAITAVKMAECKIAQNELDQAKILLESQLTYFDATGNKSLLATSLTFLGDIASKQFKHLKAIEYYEKAQSFFGKLDIPSMIQDVGIKLFVQYSILGDIEKANESEVLYKALRDTLEDQRIAEVIGELEAKYETEKKEAQISSLQQQSKIQDLQIQQRNQTIVIGSITFVFVLALLYFVNAQRIAKKRKRQIELEQRFLLSQLNPHFISNALVAIQSSVLENNTEEVTSYLSVFSRLMREILENSRQESIPVEDELSMLSNYLEINRRRLGNRFDYEIHVDEVIDQELDKVPPMFIQPFVENAIAHGLPADAQGKISVHLIKENELIRVTVKDNGPGIALTQGSTKNHQSVSTSIIEERIALFNQSLKHKIKLLIENWVDSNGKIGGTQVELYIPIN